MTDHDHSLRTPCNNCPFRTDIRPYLRAARAAEIAHGSERHELYCHKTTVHDDEGDPQIVHGRSKVCAGMMICLEKVNRPSQMMRISERLGCYDMRKLDMDAPVYDSPEAFIAAHRREEARSTSERKRPWRASTSAMAAGKKLRQATTAATTSNQSPGSNVATKTGSKMRAAGSASSRSRKKPARPGS